MFMALYCILKKGLFETGFFYHVLLPIMLVETVLELVLINLVESWTSKTKGRNKK